MSAVAAAQAANISVCVGCCAENAAACVGHAAIIIGPGRSKSDVRHPSALGTSAPQHPGLRPLSAYALIGLTGHRVWARRATTGTIGKPSSHGEPMRIA